MHSILQNKGLAIKSCYTVSGIILTNTCSHAYSYLYCYVVQSQQVRSRGTSQLVHQEGQNDIHLDQQSGKLV